VPCTNSGRAERVPVRGGRGRGTRTRGAVPVRVAPGPPEPHLAASGAHDPPQTELPARCAQQHHLRRRYV